MTKKNFFILFIFFLAFILRVYKFSNIQFDSDFGRDCLYAGRILNGHFTLLGAQTSVGGFFLGPLYFYFLAFIFLIFGLNPAVVSFVFALMNILAIYLGFKFLKKHVSDFAGIIFAILATVQPLLINASRGATHQPMLFLITITFLIFFTKALESKKIFWYFLSALVFGVFFHVHLSALLLLPGFLGLSLFYPKEKIIRRFKYLLAIILGFIIMLLPLIIFDIRHHFITSTAAFNYFLNSARGESINTALTHWTLTTKLIKINEILSENSFGFIFLVLCLWSAYKSKKQILRHTFLFVISTFFISVTLLFFFYNGYFFDYYLIPYITVILLFVSTFVSFIKPKAIPISIIFISAVLFVFKLNYQEPFRTIKNLNPITKKIEIDIVKTKPKSFTIFKDSTDGLTGHGFEYRFLLYKHGFSSVNENYYQYADVLYVIAETNKLNPLKILNWELQQFAGKKYQFLGTVKNSVKNVYLYRVNK